MIPKKINQVKELQIVLKISERCNLACSYCYFFFGGDESYKMHPPLIKDDVLSKLQIFVTNAIDSLGIKRVQFIFHGGEPLLMKKNRFEKILIDFLNAFKEKVNIKFLIQTNGILLDNEWFDIFNKYKVAVGISLDGPKEYNDQYRIDKKGKGSHEKVVSALTKLLPENKKKIGCLSVINPNFDPKIIYKHFIDELNFSGINVLIPDYNHDDHPQSIGDYLCQLFDVWLEQDDPSISIRIFEDVMNQLLGNEEHMLDTTYEPQKVVLLSISSSGHIYYDDTLKSIMKTGKYTIFETSFLEYLATDEFQNMLEETQKIPDGCVDCVWKKVCRGGRMVNRYSAKNGFNNPSVYCHDLKMLYEHVTKSLLKRQIPKEVILKNLCA